MLAVDFTVDVDHVTAVPLAAEQHALPVGLDNWQVSSQRGRIEKHSQFRMTQDFSVKASDELVNGFRAIDIRLLPDGQCQCIHDLMNRRIQHQQQ